MRLSSLFFDYRPYMVALTLILLMFLGSFLQVGARESLNSPGEGMLFARNAEGVLLGPCTLEKTDVKADVSGYVASVTVNQVFTNPYANTKIDAVYTFPLSDRGAVDEMHMQIGKRIIVGEIQTRKKASEIYEAAKKQGKIACLLDEERPNIFTQQVANIAPGEKIVVSIHYCELLNFEKGLYEFVFPTTVGPRFIPGKSIGKSGSGYSPDTARVIDASKITPVSAPPKLRPGNISFSLTIDAGLDLRMVQSKLHEVSMEKLSLEKYKIKLLNKDEIPNRDIVVNWRVAGNGVKAGVLTHRSAKDKEGFFTLMLIPPELPRPSEIAPKEMIFVVDCSGSQAGLPIDKAKETLNYIVDRMNANDTFQIIAFNNTTSYLFDKPEKNSRSMRHRAHQFISRLEGKGGTFMADAVREACATPASGNRLRIVTFMTDGYVGNDYEILDLVKSLRGNSRWFSFGTGDSVNRFLLNGIAKEGGGEADFILLSSPSEEIARKFYEKIKSPVLTNVKLDFRGLKVDSVTPKAVSDVWSDKPVCFTGRYFDATNGQVVITGRVGEKKYKKVLNLTLSGINENNSALASVWARRQVDSLLSKDYLATQNKTLQDDVKEKIEQFGLKYNLLTPYTSFVAVDSRSGVIGPSQKVLVPSAAPQGVSQKNDVFYGKHKFWEEDMVSNFYHGLVGAPVDPRYGQSNEAGQLGDFGYDSRRDIVLLLTCIVALVVLSLVTVLNIKKRLTVKKRILSLICVFVVPYLFLFAGMFLINNIYSG